MRKRSTPVSADNNSLFLNFLRIAMKSRIAFFALLALLLPAVWYSCSDKNPKEIETRVEAVYQSLKYHTIDSLRPYLASGFTVKGLPQGLEPMILPTVFKELPEPNRYEIIESTPEKRGTRLKVTFFFSKIDPIHADFLIASDGKFLEFNLLENAKIKTTSDSVR